MVDPELQRLSRYPFLRTASEFMARQDISLGEIIADRTYEQARAGGLHRLMDTLHYRRIDPPSASGYADHLNDIISYVVARILVSSVADSILTNWYAVAEATRATNLLASEDVDFVEDVARELGMGLERPEDLDGAGSVKSGSVVSATTVGTGTGGARTTMGDKGQAGVGEETDFLMHFTDYLVYAPRLKSPKWKLVNIPMKNGWIPLSKARVVRLLREVLAERFERELSEIKVDRAIVRIFRPQINDVRNRMAEIRNVMEQQSFTELDIGRIPPCMSFILNMMRGGQNVSHIARFTMTAFLVHIGMKPQAIVELFRVSPDFREDIASYQVEHIAGEISGTEYSPLSCDSMRTNGICYHKDELCGKIKHPLSYYEQRMESLRPVDERRRLREACSTAASNARFQKLPDNKAAALRDGLLKIFGKCEYDLEDVKGKLPTLPAIPASIAPDKVVALHFGVVRAGHSSVVFRHPSRPEDIYTVYTYANLMDSRGKTINTTNILDWNLGCIMRDREKEGKKLTLAGQFLSLDENRRLFHVVGIPGEAKAKAKAKAIEKVEVKEKNKDKNKEKGGD